MEVDQNGHFQEVSENLNILTLVQGCGENWEDGEDQGGEDET